MGAAAAGRGCSLRPTRRPAAAAGETAGPWSTAGLHAHITAEAAAAAPLCTRRVEDGVHCEREARPEEVVARPPLGARRRLREGQPLLPGRLPLADARLDDDAERRGLRSPGQAGWVGAAPSAQQSTLFHTSRRMRRRDGAWGRRAFGRLAWPSLQSSPASSLSRWYSVWLLSSRQSRGRAQRVRRGRPIKR